MNFIQQELLRQRELWRTLLLGGREEIRETERETQTLFGEEGESPSLPAALSEAVLRARDGQAESAGELERIQELARMSAEAKKTAARRDFAIAGSAAAPWKSDLDWPDFLRRTSAHFAKGQKAQLTKGMQANDALPEGGAGSPASLQDAVNSTRLAAAEVWPGEAAVMDPKALSRAFERDARRYDGGFSLY